MKKLKHKTKVITIISILTLLLHSIIIILPTVGAQKTVVDLTIFPSHEVTGVNQLLRLDLQATPRILGEFTGPEIWPDAYVTYTRPDGTTDIQEGPFKMDDYSRNLVWDYYPDTTGTWTVQFYWPGDENYEATSTEISITVQQEPAPRLSTVCNLFFRPNPIGLGQTLLVNAWVTPRPLLPGDVFEGLYIIFTKPDGTTDTIGPLTSFPEGTVWFEYVVDALGTWTIQFQWDGNELAEPSSTEKQTLVVQEDPIPSWPVAAPPTQPWDWPVNPENREWADIIGPYLMPTGSTGLGYDCTGSRFNLYTQAPNSAHVLWKIPPVSGMGGLIGGMYGQIPTFSGSPASVNVIMTGRGYYQSGGNIYCIDIHTGEELWSVPGSYTFGTIENGPQLVDLGAAGNAPGRGKRELIKYDGLTGAEILRLMISDDPNARVAFLAHDYVYAYLAVVPPGNDPQIGPCNLLKVSITGTSGDIKSRLVYNVTWPFGPNDIGVALYNDVLTRIAFPVYGPSGSVDTTSGEVLWSKTIYEIFGETTNILAKPEHTGSQNGILFFAIDNKRWAAVKMDTGDLLWISEQADYPWGDFWAYGSGHAYGMLYALSYAGVYAFDITTGKIVWHYSSGDAGYETPYATWPFGSADPIVADGKVYAPTSEHSPNIYYRGQKLHCIDAYTGDPVWNIMGYWILNAVAEGILSATNRYDENTYGFGKGETVTTISVSDEVIAKDSSVLLKGSVLDVSPAQKGTAAIADEYMSEWMEYLHMEQPMPADAKGVEVIFTVVDSNNNCYEIGRTTSSVTGQYSFLWEPEIPGEFQITATFAGSESYYSSSAETFLGVTQSPSPGQQLEPELAEPTGATEAPFIATDVVVILAVVIFAVIALAGFFVFRKQR